MTSQMKKRIAIDVTLVLMATAVFAAILSAVGYIGYAHAQGSGAPVSPPSADTSDIISFLTSGKYLAAVGAGLVVVVGLLRNFVLSRVAWFQTQIGGYALSWTVTTAVYVGAALEQSQPITGALLATAAVVGLTASGILDHFRDLKSAMKKPVIPLTTMVLIVSLICVASCSWFSHTAEPTVVAGAKCELGAAEQVVKDDGVSILMDIASAVVSGGKTLSQLLTRLETDFGAPTIACASLMVDDVLSAPSTGVTAPELPPGLLELRSQIKTRGYAGKVVK